MRLAGIVVLIVLGACGGKKKAPPPVDVNGSGSAAPVLQPTVNKLDKAMDTNEQRATPDPQ